MTSILQLKNVSKHFGTVRALGDVSVSVAAGSVHAIVGENGAGKSTLMKIISGVHQPSAGEVFWEGESVTFANPAAALKAGISIIHQELSLIANLSVSENMWLGREPKRGPFIDTQRMRSQTKELLERLELEIDPDTLVTDLPIGLRQMLELAKALSFDSRLIIMDEPTSSLTSTERDRLLEVVAQLKAEGVAVLYISHRLDEIMQATDTVTVLRDGQHIKTCPTSDVTIDDLVTLMVGREIVETGGTSTEDSERFGKPVLEIEELRDQAGELDSISFDVRAGEIVGLAGLIGAGRTPIVETLFGIRPAAVARVKVNGESYVPSTARHACDSGFALVPEDRRDQGLLPDLSIGENVTITSLAKKLVRFGVIRHSAASKVVKSMVQRLAIKLGSTQDPPTTLSGGNQQKVVIGRWLATDPCVILLDEPTRGVDVGAKSEIRAAMRDMAAEGKAILTISSDLAELLSLCHRIIVLYEGRIVDEMPIEQATEERIIAAASGLVR